MVVDVSPCTIASTWGFTSTMAFSICSGVNTSPHGTSIVCTFAPTRSAISASRWPKRPIIGTRTLSPGRKIEHNTASIPARDVPSISMVHSFLVLKISR